MACYPGLHTGPCPSCTQTDLYNVKVKLGWHNLTAPTGIHSSLEKEVPLEHSRVWQTQGCMVAARISRKFIILQVNL